MCSGRFRVHLTLLVLCFTRLSVIDESSFMSVCHSDISYDRTDDDVVNTVTSCLLSNHPLVLRTEGCVV